MSPGIVRAVLVVWLVALEARAGGEREEGTRVEVMGYQGAGSRALRLTFKSFKPNPALALWRSGEARAVVVALEAEGGEGRTVLAGARMGTAEGRGSAELERRVGERYAALLGAGGPERLEGAPWMKALRRSPRYMDEGVREAARELFNSRTVLLSVGMSLVLYVMAWAAPEPVFTKAFAAAITVGLLLTYTVAELHQVGRACLALYQEAEAARTEEELEAVAERFGKALGGVGLRVLVTVAGAKVGRAMGEGPGGGVWTRLSPPRWTLPTDALGGMTLGWGAEARVSVAGGTVVLMGVGAGTAAGAVGAAVRASRTTGECVEGKQEGYGRHHLCTNKNNTSEVTGGPWTPRFEDLFAQAGMGLDDPVNLVYLRDHQGPHPEPYHREVFRRLEKALGTCKGLAECRTKLVDELDEIARDVCTPGSNLNKLAARKP